METLIYEGVEFTLFWDGTHGKDPKHPSADADLFSKVDFVKEVDPFIERRVLSLRQNSPRRIEFLRNVEMVYAVILPSSWETHKAITAKCGLNSDSTRTALRSLVRSGRLEVRKALPPCPNLLKVYRKVSSAQPSAIQPHGK